MSHIVMRQGGKESVIKVGPRKEVRYDKHLEEPCQK